MRACMPPTRAPPDLSMQELVDLAKPGDRITITGVYRAAGVRVNPRIRETKVCGAVARSARMCTT